MITSLPVSPRFNARQHQIPAQQTTAFAKRQAGAQSSTQPQFSGLVRIAGGGFLGWASATAVSLATTVAFWSGVGSLAHKEVSQRVGGDETAAITQLKAADKQLRNGQDTNNYLAQLNQATEAYNDNGFAALPAFQQLSKSGQAQTKALLADLKAEKNWQKNWFAHNQRFNEWVDTVLVKENLVTPTQAAIVKESTREMLKNASSYEDHQHLTVQVFHNALWTILGGGALFLLGAGIAASGARKDF